jgi:23S rRNA pseudouridine2605 synthase
MKYILLKNYLKISRLIRVRFGAITLPRFLRIGQCKEMDKKEVEELLVSVGLRAFKPKQ